MHFLKTYKVNDLHWNKYIKLLYYKNKAIECSHHSAIEQNCEFDK